MLFGGQQGGQDPGEHFLALMFDLLTLKFGPIYVNISGTFQV